MRVAVSSLGRFWAFDLAREMHARGRLARLYTGYPRHLVDGVPRRMVRSCPWVLAPLEILGRLGGIEVRERLAPLAIDGYDRWTSRRLEPCDIFHCLSGFGLRTHAVARARFEAVTVCDRGSSHIRYQDELLAEEYARWGVRYRGIDRRIVHRELEEYERCDVIAVPSEFVYRSFVERGVPEAKLAKIPYGVDLTMFRPFGKQDGTFRVLHVGALSLRKGIPYLLDAAANQRIRGWEVWLIGPVHAEVRQFLAMSEGGYRYLGIVPRARLAEYYSQASVFVLASVEEGFGLVQAQAMACGIPVIATVNSGAADLFTDGVEGFIVPIRSAEAIREKLVYLYEHPDVRAAMGTAALRRVQGLGGWAAYGRRIEEIYRTALARQGNTNEGSPI